MRMCTVDSEKGLELGKLGQAEMGCAVFAHAHCLLPKGRALPKGAGSLQLPRWRIFLKKGRGAAAEN